MWEIISYILNFVGLFCFIASFLIKGKKMGLILFLNFCGNALIGFAYIAGGNGINGAISSFLGALQALINYAFESREKRLPIWLVAVYAVAFIGVNLWVGKFTWNTLLAILACMCCIMSLVQQAGGAYRLWALGNNGVWCIYDLVSKAYGSLIIHVVLTVFTLVGIFVYDRKTPRKEEKQEDEQKQPMEE